MATKSILKNIRIKDAKAARRLVGAMERSQEKQPRPVVVKRSVSEATREEVRAIFGGKK